MSSTPEGGPRIALLFDDQAMGARLRGALSEYGACIVLESKVSNFDSALLAEHDPDVVVLNLDPAEDDAFARVVEALDAERQRLVLNDAEATRDLAGWDAARWSRHLAAKILGTDVDPPRPATAVPVPVPASMVHVMADAAKAEPRVHSAGSDDDRPVTEYPEPAMNAALGREIETVLGDLSEGESGPASAADVSVAGRMPFAAPSATDTVHDDVDALLATFMEHDTMQGSAAADVALPEAFEAAVRSGMNTDDDGDARAREAVPEDDSLRAHPSIADSAMSRHEPEKTSLHAGESGDETAGIIDFDLDALLAELPAPSMVPLGSDAGIVTAPVGGDEAREAPTEHAASVEEPILPERLSQEEALAHRVDAGVEDFSSADLDALLADFLPPPPSGDATLPAPIDKSFEADVAEDPLLSILAEEAHSEDSAYEDFDPETWAPPEELRATDRALDLEIGPDVQSASPSGDGPQPVAATPVRIGEEAPDLELMLDEMFDQPVPEAPAKPDAAPFEQAVPDWGLVDFDSERPAADPSQTTSTEQAVSSAVDGPVKETSEIEHLDGLDLLPIEDLPLQPSVQRPRFAAQGNDLNRVIVIGASIGGPDAVREFLMAMQPGLPALVVIAQHLDEAFFPGYAAQFERALPHPVRVAADGLNAAAGEVLLVPPHARVSIDPEGGVHLLPAGEARYTPSIDETFTRIADVFGERALALVFSGMANDAVSGMQRIVERGGQVWTQSRETCVVSAMVDAADATGIVTFTGTPQDLAVRLNAVLSAG